MRARAKIFVCKTCGKEFQSDKWDKNRTPKYCSRECCGKSNAKWKTCAHCGKHFYNWTHDKYCCKECANAALRGIPLSDEHRRKLSEGRKNSPKCHGENLYNWKGGAETYRERMKFHNARRRSAQRLKLDKRYLTLLLRLQGNKCFYCGKDMGEHPSLEHLTPVSRGGDNQNYNLVYACKSCNSHKHDATLEEYAIKTGNLALCDKYDYLIARFYQPYNEHHRK